MRFFSHPLPRNAAGPSLVDCARLATSDAMPELTCRQAMGPFSNEAMVMRVALAVNTIKVYVNARHGVLPEVFV